MKITLSLLATLALLATSFAAPKSYQVTGPVLEVNDTMIAIKKGSERWEIARDTTTKVTGDLKVGTKVTIQYTMSASAIDAKPAGKDKAAPAASASPKK